MNIEAENLDSLRKLVRELQEENAYLKEKLKKASIAYPENNVFEDKMEDTAEYDPDQRERIIDKFITEDMVLFSTLNDAPFFTLNSVITA